MYRQSFFNYKQRKHFIFQATGLQTGFFYEIQCFITRIIYMFHPLIIYKCHPLLNDIGGLVCMLTYLSEFFCCHRISTFNLSSTCLLMSLTTSFLKSEKKCSEPIDSPYYLCLLSIVHTLTTVFVFVR